MSEQTPPNRGDWLREIMENARREVASWPEWKRREARAWFEESARPFRPSRYPCVLKDGTIV